MKILPTLPVEFKNNSTGSHNIKARICCAVNAMIYFNQKTAFWQNLKWFF